jgi:hypothetical protein
MSLFNKPGLRVPAAGLIVIAGILSTIASGGSGSGSGDGNGSNPPPPPPVTTGPTLPITAGNAEDVAAALITAMTASFDFGDIAGPGATPASAGSLAVALKRPPPADSSTPPLGYALLPEACAISGTVDITETLADPTRLTVGDRIEAVFDACDDGDGYVISGTIGLEISALQGDLLTDVFLLGLAVTLGDVVVVEGEGTDALTADGDFTLTFDSLDFPVISQRLEGRSLAFGIGAETVTLEDFDHFIEADTGASPEVLSVEVAGQLSSSALGGSVLYRTTSVIHVIEDFAPFTGKIVVDGADDSVMNVIFSPVGDSDVTLEIDENGDGVIDDYIYTSYFALNANSSTINVSTAPAIAREVIGGVTGFGSLTVAAGSQFVAAAPYGQLQAQAVSGDFGPVEIDCALGGSASVAGHVAAAGTYSPDDLLATMFTGCARGGEVLDGPMDLTITGFNQLAGDAYLVTAGVEQSGFVRNVDGNPYVGTGSFDTSYDFRYTSPGFVYMTSTANTFVVAQTWYERTLTSPGVTAEIVAGPPPVTVVRSSSGRLASNFLDGTFDYESVVPDSFLFDSDPATGPFSGELLVTAGDGSTLRIVAIDALNVRLDIDYDGNGFADAGLETTWAALQ